MGGIDRSALGAPSKVGWCFAEDEENLPEGWDPLSVTRGFERGDNTVTLFAGHGPIGCIDQISRTPESLIRTLAQQLQAVGNRKLRAMIDDPRANVFAGAGWSKARFYQSWSPCFKWILHFQRGALGIEEGLRCRGGDGIWLSTRRDPQTPEWSPMIVRAGEERGLSGFWRLGSGSKEARQLLTGSVALRSRSSGLRSRSRETLVPSSLC